MMSVEQEGHHSICQDGHVGGKELVKQDSFLDDQENMGVVTTEDEGYETPGSKMIDQKKATSVKEKDTVREGYHL